MFSSRVTEYLRTLERRPHVAVDNVRTALLRAQVPRSEAFIDFHQAVAGYVEHYGRDTFIFGIVHEQPTWLTRLEADVFEDSGIWYASCADAHPSYYLCMDSDGVLYQTAMVPVASSYRVKFEQDAALWDFMRRVDAHPCQLRVAPSAPQLLATLLELHDALDGAASDDFSRVYSRDDFLIRTIVDKTCDVWIRRGTRPPELAQIVTLPSGAA